MAIAFDRYIVGLGVTSGVVLVKVQGGIDVVTKLPHSERKNRNKCRMHAWAPLTEISAFVLFDNNAFLPPTSETPQPGRRGVWCGRVRVWYCRRSKLSSAFTRGKVVCDGNTNRMPCGLLLPLLYRIPPENGWLMWRWDGAVHLVKDPFLSVRIFLENNKISTMVWKLEYDLFFLIFSPVLWQ